MWWTWERLRAAVVSLELPDDGYVVGLSGAMLANGSMDSAEEVVLIASDELYDELVREGWPAYDELAGLQCPTEPGLFVRAGDVSDTYLATVPELLADAWREDGVPVVSVLQIHRASIEQFLSQGDAEDRAEPTGTTWTWERLRAALERLALPHDQYVVGVAGALLANESLPSVSEVELVVDEQLHAELARAWIRDDQRGVLFCPFEDDLFARTGDVSDTYAAPITALVVEAWRQDGVPVVSMVQVRRDAIRALVPD